MDLNDQQQEAALRALRRIAADNEKTRNGHRKRLARHEAINIARQACEALGLSYDEKSVAGGAL